MGIYYSVHSRKKRKGEVRRGVNDFSLNGEAETRRGISQPVDASKWRGKRRKRLPGGKDFTEDHVVPCTEEIRSKKKIV